MCIRDSTCSQHDHIVRRLSRRRNGAPGKLGAANHYPAIDVLASASRVMNAVITPEHKRAAGRLRELMAKYQEVELLVKIGEYKRGGDAVTDEAIDKIAAINQFLRQRTDERATLPDALAQMTAIVGTA